MADLTTEPEVQLRMFSQPRFLAAVRALVGTMAQRLGFNEMQCGQISLAVDEALCNVITHGYDRKPDGQLWISIWALPGTPTGLKIVIEDLANQVDPAAIQPRDLDDIRPGGLGVHIIREVMDEVTWERRSPEGMRLTMIKRV
ncbi:MAG: ATP-binding protein [Planctomycetes bacterium]|nr:ATP-binding protein [Planctomycetota bacterium]